MKYNLHRNTYPWVWDIGHPLVWGYVVGYFFMYSHMCVFVCVLILGGGKENLQLKSPRSFSGRYHACLYGERERSGSVVVSSGFVSCLSFSSSPPPLRAVAALGDRNWPQHVRFEIEAHLACVDILSHIR